MGLTDSRSDDLYYIHSQIAVGVDNLVFDLTGEISSSSDDSEGIMFEHYLTSASQAMARMKKMRRGGGGGGVGVNMRSGGGGAGQQPQLSAGGLPLVVKSPRKSPRGQKANRTGFSSDDTLSDGSSRSK